MNTIQDRIVEYLKTKGDSKYRFYQKTGLSNGFLDKVGSIGSEKCEIISSHYPDLNLEWAITGQGSMMKQTVIRQVNEDIEIYGKMPIKKGIPIIPIEAMAGFSKGENTVLELECEHYYVPEFQSKANFLIRIAGTSMSPKYYNGDVVACKTIPKETFIQWGKVYVMDTIQGALCKRLFQSDKGDEWVKVVSDNDKYPPFEMKKKEIRSLAIVIGVIRLE